MSCTNTIKMDLLNTRPLFKSLNPDFFSHFYFWEYDKIHKNISKKLLSIICFLKRDLHPTMNISVFKNNQELIEFFEMILDAYLFEWYFKVIQEAENTGIIPVTVRPLAEEILIWLNTAAISKEQNINFYEKNLNNIQKEILQKIIIRLDWDYPKTKLKEQVDWLFQNAYTESEITRLKEIAKDLDYLGI